jgi:hypothetical protein
MKDLDRRIADVLVGKGGWNEDAAQRLDARLTDEPSPAAMSRRRAGRRMAACVGMALVSGFVTTGALQLRSQAAEAPRWPAAAMENSPSALLLSDRRR